MHSTFGTSELLALGAAALALLLFIHWAMDRITAAVVKGLVSYHLGSLPIPRTIRINGFIEEIPPHFLLLLSLMEDDRYWNHAGLNLPELWRSLQYSIKNRTLKGGSSITQQTAKGLLSSIFANSKVPREKVLRKILEIPGSVSASAIFR